MNTIGAVSPCRLTGTEAGITKPLRLDWDAAPFFNDKRPMPGTTAAHCPRDLYMALSDSAPEIQGL
jgi:hypothetical protein